GFTRAPTRDARSRSNNLKPRDLIPGLLLASDSLYLLDLYSMLQRLNNLSIDVSRQRRHRVGGAARDTESARADDVHPAPQSRGKSGRQRVARADGTDDRNLRRGDRVK